MLRAAVGPMTGVPSIRTALRELDPNTPLFAYQFSPVLEGLLFEVSTGEPVTFVGAPLLLIAVALIASYLPARKAMRVDPLHALRHE